MKGPPWRSVSGRWEACRHHRERQSRACSGPIRRAGPLLLVLLPSRAPSRGTAQDGAMKGPPWRSVSGRFFPWGERLHDVRLGHMQLK